MRINSKILICYNSPVNFFTNYNGKPTVGSNFGNDLSETSFQREINSIKKSLQEYFTEVRTLSVDRNVERCIEKINSHSPDAILNFIESVEGVSTYEYCMAGLFEIMNVEFTGNQPQTLGNCLNKWRAKCILRANNIKTPKAVVIDEPSNFNENSLKLNFPIILKLLNEDASIGISEYSVVNNVDELIRHSRFLLETYNQKIIAEEFIEGRELNVAILGNQVLPISEILFDGLPYGLPKIVTYDGKWIAESVYYENTKPKCPANLDARTKKRVEAVAFKAFKALGCRDYARVDIRLNEDGIPFVIEVNPNPDISSDSGFARAATAAGISHSELLFTIIKFALNRKANDTQIKAS